MGSIYAKTNTPSSPSSSSSMKGKGLLLQESSNVSKTVNGSNPFRCTPEWMDNPPPEITERHKEIIKETWKVIESHVASVGVVLFVKLFETHPDVQEVFTPFRGMSIDDIKTSKQLRAHALRVMGFVEKAVSRLNQPEKLISLLTESGSNHIRYGVEFHQFDFVGPQFVEAIQPALGSSWNTEVEEAWTILMLNVTYIMKKALYEKMKSESCKSCC